jgi:hypothetical protein
VELKVYYGFRVVEILYGFSVVRDAPGGRLSSGCGGSVAGVRDIFLSKLADIHYSYPRPCLVPKFLAKCE